jgi:hypothetical protein
MVKELDYCGPMVMQHPKKMTKVLSFSEATRVLESVGIFHEANISNGTAIYRPWTRHSGLHPVLNQ